MKKILVNKEVWQTRVAILDNDRLQDIYFHAHSKSDLERCFFKGKIAKILPGIQTAFVNFGQPKAGFLHISEIDRALAAEKMFELQSEDESQDLETFERIVKKSMDISKIFKEGDEILVQVIKEPIYEKGAKLTTCFTLPGKFVVLMPNIPQVGISKKIENRDERFRLRELIKKILPAGMGIIIRTTAEGRDDKDIAKDLSFLTDTWNSIQKKFVKAKSNDKIHEDLPLELQVVRDHLDEGVEIVITDDAQAQKELHKFIKMLTPEQTYKVRLYQSPPSLFDQFYVEQQIEEALKKKVELKSGGSLIIETAEAMTVIDVNTGRFIGKGDMEDTIFKTNIEAAEEIVRQLRLRNIGGLIVIDFIDMSDYSNRKELSRFLEKTLKERDKYQSVALKVSEFGLIQMTRKRSGKTLVQQIMHECPTCKSFGYVKSSITISFEVLRKFLEHVINKKINGPVTLLVSQIVYDYLLHTEFQAILMLEKKLKYKIVLESDETFEKAKFSVRKAKCS